MDHQGPPRQVHHLQQAPIRPSAPGERRVHVQGAVGRYRPQVRGQAQRGGCRVYAAGDVHQEVGGRQPGAAHRLVQIDQPAAGQVRPWYTVACHCDSRRCPADSAADGSGYPGPRAVHDAVPLHPEHGRVGRRQGQHLRLVPVQVRGGRGQADGRMASSADGGEGQARRLSCCGALHCRSVRRGRPQGRATRLLPLRQARAQGRQVLDASP